MTFIGIGIIVNMILVYVAVLIRGERRQNQEVDGLTRSRPSRLSAQSAPAAAAGR